MFQQKHITPIFFTFRRCYYFFWLPPTRPCPRKNNTKLKSPARVGGTPFGAWAKECQESRCRAIGFFFPPPGETFIECLLKNVPRKPNTKKNALNMWSEMVSVCKKWTRSISFSSAPTFLDVIYIYIHIFFRCIHFMIYIICVYIFIYTYVLYRISIQYMWMYTYIYIICCKHIYLDAFFWHRPQIQILPTKSTQSPLQLRILPWLLVVLYNSWRTPCDAETVESSQEIFRKQ